MNYGKITEALSNAEQDSQMEIRLTFNQKVKVKKEFRETARLGAYTQMRVWLQKALDMKEWEFNKKNVMSFFERKGCIVEKSDAVVVFDGTKL